MDYNSYNIQSIYKESLPCNLINYKTTTLPQVAKLNNFTFPNKLELKNSVIFSNLVKINSSFIEISIYL